MTFFFCLPGLFKYLITQFYMITLNLHYVNLPYLNYILIDTTAIFILFT